LVSSRYTPARDRKRCRRVVAEAAGIIVLIPLTLPIYLARRPNDVVQRHHGKSRKDAAASASSTPNETVPSNGAARCGA
jgi:hypothetical protein